MNHQRKQIRAAIVAQLIAASTAASTRVYDNPVDDRSVFPTLVVEDDGEGQSVGSGFGGMAGRIIERTLNLLITAEVKQNAGYAGARDDLIGQVEVALATSGIAGVKSITPTGFQPELSAVGDQPVALGRQRFDVVYLTTQGNPETTF